MLRKIIIASVLLLPVLAAVPLHAADSNNVLAQRAAACRGHATYKIRGHLSSQKPVFEKGWEHCSGDLDAWKNRYEQEIAALHELGRQREAAARASAPDSDAIKSIKSQTQK
jgi:hypothetical protein